MIVPAGPITSKASGDMSKNWCKLVAVTRTGAGEEWSRRSLGNKIFTFRLLSDIICTRRTVRWSAFLPLSLLVYSVRETAVQVFFGVQGVSNSPFATDCKSQHSACGLCIDLLMGEWSEPEASWTTATQIVIQIPPAESIWHTFGDRRMCDRIENNCSFTFSSHGAFPYPDVHHSLVCLTFWP